MKLTILPTYEKGGLVKRGRMADWVFKLADKAHAVEHDASDGTEIQKRITLEEARQLWTDNRRAIMKRLPRGPFVFVIMNGCGYTRVSLWGHA